MGDQYAKYPVLHYICYQINIPPNVYLNYTYLLHGIKEEGIWKRSLAQPVTGQYTQTNMIT